MAAEKVALITAGGSGMGAGAARRLAADGFRVAILSSSGKGEALASELGGLGVTGSNKSNDDLKRLVDGAVAKWGRIDVLVNSAGHGPRAPIVEISDEQWHTGLDTYLLNVIRPTRLVTPIMQAQKAGAIINISTAWAFEPSAMFPTSAVFRAGLAAFTKIFTDTYAADNIRMNNVLPGWITGDRGASRQRADAPLWQGRGDRRDDLLPGLRRRGLHHRTKHPRRWRTDAVGLTVIARRSAAPVWGGSCSGRSRADTRRDWQAGRCRACSPVRGRNSRRRC
jgi:NAD(P)-dependent dehydrogenase (short-subunit alcohol dehydrogenase family)